MKKYQQLVSFLAAIFLAACGGGGENTALQNETKTAAVVEVVPAQAPVAAAKVAPTLLAGVQAPFEVAQYAVSSLLLTEQSFGDLSEQLCVGKTAFAQDRATGLVEIVCADEGRRLQYDTETRSLKVMAALPKKETYQPTVACSEGVCMFGRGIQSFPWQLPSDAEMIVASGDNVLARVSFPDRKENRAPAKLAVDADGIVVAVTRGFDQSNIAIHRFDPRSRTFIGSCSLPKTQMHDAVVSNGTVFVSVYNYVGTGFDIVGFDTKTCAAKMTYRVPVGDEGFVLAKAMAVVGDKLYVAGGSERLAAFGVWQFDVSSARVVSTKQMNSLPTALVASLKSDVLYVATEGGQVHEVDTVTMVTTREFAKVTHKGDLFLVE